MTTTHDAYQMSARNYRADAVHFRALAALSPFALAYRLRKMAEQAERDAARCQAIADATD